MACVGFKTMLCIGRFIETSHLSLLLKLHHQLLTIELRIADFNIVSKINFNAIFSILNKINLNVAYIFTAVYLSNVFKHTSIQLYVTK